MTWTEIRKIHTWLPESSDGWHQHENGGGWVANSATVSNLAMVHEKSVIAAWVSIAEDVSIAAGVSIAEGVCIERSPQSNHDCRYVVNESGAGKIRIGCETFAYEELDAMFIKHSTPENERIKYRFVVDSIRRFAEAWPLDRPMPLEAK